MSERNCMNCAAYVGGGLCRDNLEAECAAGGGYEAWHADEKPSDAGWMVARMLDAMAVADKNNHYAAYVRKMCERAIGHYGVLSQMVIAIEEMSEVQKELCKQLRGAKDLGGLIEEIADAAIMLYQMAYGHDIIPAVLDMMYRKALRLCLRMKEDEDNEHT